MADVSTQALALMNAEMAARIFMHIAQEAPSPAPATAKLFQLSDLEQQALRDISDSTAPCVDP